jgi:hypothetical protein
MHRLLFIVVIVLFGIMNIGAVIGFILDSRQRNSFFERLKMPDVGFHTEGADDAVWLWRFSLDPLFAEIGAPTGTAVALTGLLGLPLARLRAALPDEVRTHAWCLSHSLLHRPPLPVAWFCFWRSPVGRHSSSHCARRLLCPSTAPRVGPGQRAGAETHPQQIDDGRVHETAA